MKISVKRVFTFRANYRCFSMSQLWREKFGFWLYLEVVLVVDLTNYWRLFELKHTFRG